MKTIFLKLCFIALCATALSSCYYWQERNNNSPVFISNTAFKPVYTSAATAEVISVSAPQKLENVGKIYYKDNFIFINEAAKGIHIINNVNPRSPQKIAFLNIKGCTDIVIKGNLLYANNITDLVVIDVTVPQNAVLKTRIENAFLNTQRPPQRNVSFICPDASKGIVVGWEEITSQEERKLANCF
jgi:hypothetical protein